MRVVEMQLFTISFQRAVGKVAAARGGVQVTLSLHLVG